MCYHDNDEYEPNMQPVPGHSGWTYDANLGEWRDGMSMSTGLPLARWKSLYTGITSRADEEMPSTSVTFVTWGDGSSVIYTGPIRRRIAKWSGRISGAWAVLTGKHTDVAWDDL